jgi:predicted RNA-binding Zn ribbon-like protein
VANHRVSGQLVPDAVSGHVALELANTRAGWGEDHPREYLVSYDALAVWAGDVSLLTPTEVRRLRRDARTSPAAAERVVHTTIAFRDAWYAVATSPWNDRPFPREHLDVIAAAVGRAADVSSLRPVPGGDALALDGGGTRAALHLPLHRAVLAAYDVLARGDVAHVGQCAGHGCGWLFFDPSHRRHWCIMAICGNRAKARAFAERRRASSAVVTAADRTASRRRRATLTG